MRVNITNKVFRRNVAWIDNLYGTSAGVVDRPDRPFDTFENAWAAVAAAGKTGNIEFRISIGTHTIVNTLNDSGWSTSSKVTIVCEGQPHQTTINYTGTGAIFTIQSSGAVAKRFEIQGGTWNRTSATASLMFNLQGSPNIRGRFKGMNINDSLGSGGIMYQRTTDLIDDCIINANSNPYVFVASSTTESEIKIENSFISAPIGNIMGGASGTVRPMALYNSVISAPTGTFLSGSANSNVTLQFNKCDITIQGIAFEGRTLNVKAKDTKITTSTNGAIMRFNTSTGNGLQGILSADGLYMNQPITTTGKCILRTGAGIVRIFSYGRGLNYLEGHEPTQGTEFVPGTNFNDVNGRVGFRLESVITNPSTITVNLTNAGGLPYNSAPISYPVTSTDPTVATAAIKALIDAQIALGAGNPWYEWTQGETDRVIDLVPDGSGRPGVVIIAHPAAPGAFGIDINANYTSSTVPADVVFDLNIAPDGIVEMLGGPMNATPKIAWDNALTLLPIAQMIPVQKLREY